MTNRTGPLERENRHKNRSGAGRLSRICYPGATLLGVGLLALTSLPAAAVYTLDEAVWSVERVGWWCEVGVMNGVR